MRRLVPAALLLVLPLAACDPPGPPRIVDHVDGCDVWYLEAEDIYVTKCPTASASTDWDRLVGKTERHYHSSSAPSTP